jgi:quercetin dioxygenase-like cupin family protein
MSNVCGKEDTRVVALIFRSLRRNKGGDQPLAGVMSLNVVNLPCPIQLLGLSADFRIFSADRFTGGCSTQFEETLMNPGLVKIVAPMLLFLATLVYSQGTALPGQPPQSSGRFTVKTCVNEFTPSRVESTKAGYQYWFIGRDFLDGRTLKMSVVKPHSATHPPHRHAEYEFFFVLEGIAEVVLNGEKRVIHPYASFYCPPNSEHGIRNVGDSELKYLVIKKYETR